MKHSIRMIAAFGFAAVMVTSACSKSAVPAKDQATADGQAGGGAGGAGAAGRLSSSAVSIQATKLPDGIRMRLVDNMTSEDAVKTVGNVPESAKFLGAFKLNGSGTLQGSVVQVAAGADLYDLKFPADPVKLPATVFLFAATLTSKETLGLTDPTAKEVEVKCDDSGSCGAIENNEANDSATGGEGQNIGAKSTGGTDDKCDKSNTLSCVDRAVCDYSVNIEDCYKKHHPGKRANGDETQSTPDKDLPPALNTCLDDATYEYVGARNKCEPVAGDVCARLELSIIIKKDYIAGNCEGKPADSEKYCIDMRRSLDRYRKTLKAKCEQPANSPPP